MTLKKLVENLGGPNRVGPLLNVTPHTVRAWLRGDGSPTMQKSMEIKRLSNNKLSFEAILKETTRNVGRK